MIFLENFKNSKLITYGIGEIVNKLAMFFFLPFAAYYMSSEEFGVAGIIIPLIQMLQGVIIFGLPISLLKFYNDYPQNKGKINFNIILLYSSIIIFIFIIISFIKYTGAFQNINIGTYAIEPYVYIILTTIILSSTVQIVLQKYQAQKQAKNFVIINTSSRISIILLLLIAIYFLKIEITSRTLVSILLVNGFIFTTISLIILLRNAIWKVDLKMLVRFLIIGFPLFVNGILSYILQMNGRYILEEEAGIEKVGAYSFVYSISQIIFLAITVYNRLFLPDFYSVLANKKNIKSYLNKNLNYSTQLISLFAIIFLPIGYFITSFYENSLYVSYIKYLPFMVILYIPYNLYLSSTNYLAYTEKTFITLIISAITGFLSIVSNIFLIRYMGIMGLFVSQVLFQFIFAVLVSFFVQNRKKEYLINYKSYMKKIIVPICVLMLLGFLNNDKYILQWIIFSAISLIALFLLIRKHSFKIIL